MNIICGKKSLVSCFWSSVLSKFDALLLAPVYNKLWPIQDNIPQSSDAKEMGEEPFALPSSSKWEVADRQEKMGKDDF